MRKLRISTLCVAAIAIGTAGCGGGDAKDADAGLFDGFVGITEISPDHGPQSGGTLVVVTGAGFLAAGAELNSFLVGAELASQVSIVSDTEVRIVTPPSNGPGAQDVTVINGNGVFSLGGVFSYNPEPTISDVNPAAGPYEGGAAITVTGTGFQNLEPGETVLLIGDVPVTGLEIKSDTEIAALTPPGVPYIVEDVSLVNDNGLGLIPDAYLYETTGLLTFARQTFGDQKAGDVFHIDPITESVQTIFNAPPEGNHQISVATRDGDTILYYTNGRTMHRLHPDGSRDNLGTVTGCQDARINAMAEHQGTIFAICRRNPAGLDFGAIDLNTMLFTAIGAVDLSGQQNLASNGTSLFHLDQNTLRTIDPLTGVFGADIGLNLPRARGMAFNEGKLFVITRGLSGGGGGNVAFLFEIDPVSGVPTLLTTLGRDKHGVVSAF